MITVYVVAESWSDERRGPVWWLISRFAKYHIYCVLDQGLRYDNVVVVDPASSGVHVYQCPRRQLDVLWHRPEIKCVAVTTRPTYTLATRFHWFGLLNCVTLTKRLLGIRKWWIITPTQLLKEVARGR